MKELRDIVTAYQQAVAAGRQMALATVVQVEGSAYRRPGARMLVTDDGKLTGAISGGCLEGDALRKALLVMRLQKPLVVTYDTMDDEDSPIGVGLGCNGIIHILIEPIDVSSELNPVRLFIQLLSRRVPAILATVFSLTDKRAEDQGTCLLYTEETLQGIGDTKTNEEMRADAGEALANRTSEIKTYPGEAGRLVLYDLVVPEISLIIIGAGNDTIPLMKLADVLGWQTTVADGRPNYATPERFPLAKKILLAKPAEALEQIETDEQTAVVLMTHNFHYDLAALKICLQKKLFYVGVLGPKKKMQKMLQEVEGGELLERQLRQVYGPVGLDIGAETSEEIALSIAAEIKAAFANRSGISLRIFDKPIHAEISPVE